MASRRRQRRARLQWPRVTGRTLIFAAMGTAVAGAAVVAVVLSGASGDSSAPSSADRFVHQHGLAAPSSASRHGLRLMVALPNRLTHWST